MFRKKLKLKVIPIRLQEGIEHRRDLVLNKKEILEGEEKAVRNLQYKTPFFVRIPTYLRLNGEYEFTGVDQYFIASKELGYYTGHISHEHAGETLEKHLEMLKQEE